MLSLPGRCQIHLYDYLSMWNAGPIMTPILGNIILHYIIPIGICILLLFLHLNQSESYLNFCTIFSRPSILRV